VTAEQTRAKEITQGLAAPPGSVSLEAAVRRLDRAIEMLEAAAEGAREARGRVAALESELQRLGRDRSRLAQDLDAAAARSTRLEDANKEVSRRLVAAMEAIRAVLDGRGS
jgi:chromosome segregation ATPase